MKRYGVNRSSSRGEYSSTFGEGLTVTQSSMDNGWKRNTSVRTYLVSSGVGFSKSTHRKRLVSLSSVGIRNISMSLLCNRPCVVNASERIMPIPSLFEASRAGGKLRLKAAQGKFGLTSQHLRRQDPHDLIQR